MSTLHRIAPFALGALVVASALQKGMPPALFLLLMLPLGFAMLLSERARKRAQAAEPDPLPGSSEARANDLESGDPIEPSERVDWKVLVGGVAMIAALIMEWHPLARVALSLTPYQIETSSRLAAPPLHARDQVLIRRDRVEPEVGRVIWIQTGATVRGWELATVLKLGPDTLSRAFRVTRYFAGWGRPRPLESDPAGAPMPDSGPWRVAPEAVAVVAGRDPDGHALRVMILPRLWVRGTVVAILAPRWRRLD